MRKEKKLASDGALTTGAMATYRIDHSKFNLIFIDTTLDGLQQVLPENITL